MDENYSASLSQSHFEVGFLIVKRGTASRAMDVAHRAGALCGSIFLGRGTAHNSILDFWGLEMQPEYEIIMMSIPKVKLNYVINEISAAMKLSQPGKGIMFTLPAAGAAGLNVFRHILAQKGINIPEYNPVFKEELTKMNEREFSLIITMVNRGYADDAMDAARESGAEGGIIINGRGAGLQKAEKFFGISIEQEREILLNIVEKQKVNDILKAIVHKTGIKTEARGISFILPVNRATGVVRLDEINN